MKKKKKSIFALLIGIIALGIGYAAVSNVNLSINGNASAAGNLSQEDFKVRFIKSSDTTSTISAISTAAQDPAAFSVTKGNNSDASATSSVTGDTSATFSVQDMKKNDYVVFTYYIANFSDELKANVKIPVITNNKEDYFSVEATPTAAFTLNAGGTMQQVTVKVTCLEQADSETTGTFTITFEAEPEE